MKRVAETLKDISFLLRELTTTFCKGNFLERVKDLEKENHLLRGHVEEVCERQRKMEEYLGVNYKVTKEYEKKELPKIQTK